MNKKDYADFSFAGHTRQTGAFSDCRFELTFNCGLNCRHCLTSCYNKKKYLAEELGLIRIKRLLDELAELGVFWLCFSGGDPLRRKDFGRIYSYAFKKGFLITVFTSGYDLNNSILSLWKKLPPFNVEMTVNACRKDIYEKISGVDGSFERAMISLDKLQEAKIPVLTKALITKANFKHLPELKKFFKSRGISFVPDFMVYPRLNKDKSPCVLRVDDLLKKHRDACRGAGKNTELFNCAAFSSKSLYIDPWGNVYFCNLLRQFKSSAIKSGIAGAFKKARPMAESAAKNISGPCLTCGFRLKCNWCPGASYLETGELNKPLEWCCLYAGKNKA
jgi:MoaA/NifB/PqqE/SkfB family radical SAM enzyme